MLLKRLQNHNLHVLPVFLRQIGKDEHDAGSDLIAVGSAGSGYSCDGTCSAQCVVQKVEENTERPGEMCVGHGERDIVIVVAGRLFTHLCAW